MFSKLSLSLSAAVLLSTVGRIASAAPMPARSEASAAESGIPDSIEYSKRIVSLRSPSNDEIRAAETGNPDSVDYQQGMSLSSPDWKKDWQTLEIGNPDSR